MNKRILYVLIVLVLTLPMLNLFTIHTEAEPPVEIIKEVEVIKEVPVEKEIDLYEQKCSEVLLKQEALSLIENKKEWFIAYKKLINEYSEWVDSPETIYDYYSEEDINYLARAVETECYGCDFESKVHVASVILNRAENENFPDTLEGVVTASGQFVYSKKSISEDTQLAIEYAFEIEDETEGALYFHSNKMTDCFNGADYIFSDNAVHHFYK